MSTRAAIIVRGPEGRYHGIYLHNDGDLRTTGNLLQRWFNTRDRAMDIIALGNLSTLRARLTPIAQHSFDAPERGTTVAYMRDRRETGQHAFSGASARSVARRIENNQCVYVFEDGKWTFNGKDLAERLECLIPVPA
jgi:hypothetical protein